MFGSDYQGLITFIRVDFFKGDLCQWGLVLYEV